MYEVILSNGDRAEAECVTSALFAARTLVAEISKAAGASRLNRQEVIITLDGIYDGKLTQAAREGR